MRKEEARVGCCVQVRRWDDMAKEFGVLTSGSIDVPKSFTAEMKRLCELKGIITYVSDRDCISISGFDDRFFISPEMLEHTVKENCR
jgi:hypothetical protein